MVRVAVVLLGAALTAHAALPAGYDSDDWGVAACDNGTDLGCCCATSKRNNGTDPCTDTELMLCYVNQKSATGYENLTTKADEIIADGSQLWIITCGALVFFMQCGFAMLEAGSVRRRSTQNIIFKNLMDACVAALGYFCLGYAFAYGEDKGGFIGANNFFLMRENNDESKQHMFFFQFAFAATAATIVSGSVAERTTITAYLIYSFFLTTFIYPVVVHWVWSEGWASAFRSGKKFGPLGMIDYAGSGVVHAVGGFAGLCGAIAVGPRKGRFVEVEGEEGCCNAQVQPMKGQSPLMACLGVMILWFGWYGFNCGSTLAFDGENAGKVATTTTLAAAGGSVISTVLAKAITGTWDVEHGLNGVLAGLVSITAGCSVVDEWCAILIGFIGGGVYYGSAEMLLKLKVDDPLNAFPVHGMCGVWGCLAVGIFAQHRNIERAYGVSDKSHAVSSGEQLAVQLGGIAAIVGWTVATCGLMFFVLAQTGVMRVTEEEELHGLDVAEHGDAFSKSFMETQGLEAQIEILNSKQADAEQTNTPFGDKPEEKPEEKMEEK